jgi:hypothetical protein
MRNLLIKLAAGAVGGAAATALINAAMPHSKRLPARFQPIAPRQDPGDFMVKQAEKLIGALSPKMHSRAVHSLPWAYGMSWPLGLAALSGLLRLRSPGKTIAAGALLGAIVWAVGYEGWLPATGLLPPAHRAPLARNATGLVSHVAYGTIAALPLAIAVPRLQS